MFRVDFDEFFVFIEKEIDKYKHYNKVTVTINDLMTNTSYKYGKYYGVFKNDPWQYFGLNYLTVVNYGHCLLVYTIEYSDSVEKAKYKSIYIPDYVPKISMTDKLTYTLPDDFRLSTNDCDTGDRIHTDNNIMYYDVMLDIDLSVQKDIISYLLRPMLGTDRNNISVVI